MNLLPPFIGTAVSLMLSACAAGARPEAMAPAITLVGACPAYASSIEGVQTTGGEETNPLGTPKISNSDFTAALTAALTGTGLSGGTRYRLEAVITNLDQPSFSYDTTVGLTVRYLLTELSSSTPVLDEVITSSFTAKHSSASKGGKRVHIANEGAARANIENALRTICTTAAR